MSDLSAARLFVAVWFLLIGCLAVALVVVAVRAMVRSSGQQADRTTQALATGQLDATPGHEEGTWYARFVPDLGAVGALVPFSGIRKRGLVRLTGGRLEFWRDGAQAPEWVAPVHQVQVRIADIAVGRLAGYPLRLASPQSGPLLGELSLEPLNAVAELRLKDQRNHEYSRHFLHLLLAAGARPMT